VKEGLTIEYPRIKACAKRESAEISSGGETGVRSDETRHRGYAQLGLTLILKIPDCRTSRSMIAAVMNQVNVRFMSDPGGLSPERLIVFM
jgi:hypothetical protein